MSALRGPAAWWFAACAVFAGAGSLAANAAAPQISGQVRLVATDVQASLRGPLAQADVLSPGVAALPASSVALASELRGSAGVFTLVGTLQRQHKQGSGWRDDAWVNELYAAGGAQAWQFSAGKRVASWDVGQAWRPNDVVQQEQRRSLVSGTLEGRPMLMAEYFSASTAWSAVWANPQKPRRQRGAEEPALALRLYQRDGSVDWHGFARWGGHTRGSLGAAVAWVARDDLELHASARWLTAADTLASAATATPLVSTNPWQAAMATHTAQVLLGGSWTTADQFSLLAEAWWDGTALSNAQWTQWHTRNRALAALVGTPAPVSAVAGNLAWQGTAFGAAGNLRRSNLYARLSWTWEKWQPALDLLVTPADRGRIVTASLVWQGDRAKLEAAWRHYGGPAGAVLAQLPTRRQATLSGTWPF
jgi:hypothetical protein